MNLKKALLYLPTRLNQMKLFFIFFGNQRPADPEWSGSSNRLSYFFCCKGGGEVYFRCPTKMKLIPINLTDPGKIKRIRGVAYAMRVAPAICNRLVETAKGVLLKFLPDVYIVTDHQKKENAGNSPCFGLTLVAETINGTFLCGEACSLSRNLLSGSNRQDPSVPEDIALLATKNLLEEINRGGCLDSSCQHLAFLFMVLNQRDISRILSGILSPFS